MSSLKKAIKVVDILPISLLRKVGKTVVNQMYKKIHIEKMDDSTFRIKFNRLFKKLYKKNIAKDVYHKMPDKKLLKKLGKKLQYFVEVELPKKQRKGQRGGQPTWWEIIAISVGVAATGVVVGFAVAGPAGLAVAAAGAVVLYNTLTEEHVHGMPRAEYEAVVRGHAQRPQYLRWRPPTLADEQLVRIKNYFIAQDEPNQLPHGTFIPHGGDVIRIIISGWVLPRGTTPTLYETDTNLFVLEVPNDITIGQIKDRIHHGEGSLGVLRNGTIPADMMGLIFAGKTLGNDQTLSSYNIHNESTIWFVNAMSMDDAVAAAGAVAGAEGGGGNTGGYRTRKRYRKKRRKQRKTRKKRRRKRRRTRRGGKQRFKISAVPPLGTTITVHYKTDSGEKEQITGEVDGIYRHRRNSPPKLKLLVKVVSDDYEGHALHMRHRSLNRERRMAARIQKLIPLTDIIRVV